jgi:hypothetical protein
MKETLDIGHGKFMLRTRCRIVLVLLIIFSQTNYAFDKVGTTAAQFLQIGVGGRIPALGGAGVASVTGVEAMYWNPAGILEKDKLSFGAYYADWFAGLRHQFMGVTALLDKNRAIGFHYLSFGGGEFEQTTLEFQEGNGVMVDYGDLSLGASYAQRLTERFIFGGTVKFIRQKLFNETASAVALDLGSNLRTDLSGFNIGMAMSNLGGEMKLQGRDLLTSGQDETATEYQVSAWPLPLTFQVGAAWRITGLTEAYWDGIPNGLCLLFDGRHINEGLTQWRMGCEYDFRRMLFLRIGKVFGHHTEDWTFGGGVRTKVSGLILECDVGYGQMGDLGEVQRISLILKNIFVL